MAIAKGPAAHAALRVALKIQLFEAFDTESATAEELAHRCGIDPPLTARIMRELLCIGNSNEDGKEICAQNIVSKLLMKPGARATIKEMAETTNIMPKLTDYSIIETRMTGVTLSLASHITQN